MAEAKQVILTYDGLKQLEEELDMLKSVRRAEVAEKIKEARSFGDLSENSEYDEAKDEQAKLEVRIVQLENKLKNVKVIDEDEIDTKKVSIGSKIQLRNCDNDMVIEYSIVGSTEADPIKGKISDESPVGQTLLGHSVGETVEVTVPAGTISFEILGISK